VVLQLCCPFPANKSLEQYLKSFFSKTQKKILVIYLDEDKVEVVKIRIFAGEEVSEGLKKKMCELTSDCRKNSRDIVEIAARDLSFSSRWGVQERKYMRAHQSKALGEDLGFNSNVIVPFFFFLLKRRDKSCYLRRPAK
jgi:hypothetical protein